MENPSTYQCQENVCEGPAHSPPYGPGQSARRASCCAALALCIATGLSAAGCKGWSISEIRGKNQFGPEFQHDGVKRSDQIRYYTGQQFEAKWENGWTTAVTYRYRPIDEGNGNQEHLALFEVGYPIWKAPKKPEKTSEGFQKRIESLERELEGMRAKFTDNVPQPAESHAPGDEPVGNSRTADAGR